MIKIPKIKMEYVITAVVIVLILAGLFIHNSGYKSGVMDGKIETISGVVEDLQSQGYTDLVIDYVQDGVGKQFRLKLGVVDVSSSG